MNKVTHAQMFKALELGMESISVTAFLEISKEKHGLETDELDFIADSAEITLQELIEDSLIDTTDDVRNPAYWAYRAIGLMIESIAQYKEVLSD